jgi:hypothetical protein
MRELTVNYIQQNMLDAHFEINDERGNWFGVTPYYDQYRVVRNGSELCKCKTLDRVVKILQMEGC